MKISSLSWGRGLGGRRSDEGNNLEPITILNPPKSNPSLAFSLEKSELSFCP